MTRRRSARRIRLEGDGREARAVGKRAVAFSLIVRTDWHWKNLLQRVKDRVQFEVRHLRRYREPQLVAIQHPVLVILAVHAVGRREFLFQRLLRCRRLRRNELSKAPHRCVGAER